MIGRSLGLLIAALLALGLSAPAASADFGFADLDVTFTADEVGEAEISAGAHPYAFITKFGFNTKDGSPLLFDVPDGSPREVTITAVPGLVGNPTATRSCTTLEFLKEACPATTQVGVTDVTYGEPGNTGTFSFYSVAPPPGVAAKFGFTVNKVPVTVEAGVNPNPPYNILVNLENIPQALPVYGSTTTVWGNPPAAEVPFLTLPRACEGPLPTIFAARSWEGGADSGEVRTHDEEEPPGPRGFKECDRLGFGPRIAARASSRAASAPTGLDVELSVDDDAFLDAAATADSDIKKAVVTLPAGMSANPSLAERLETCSPGDLREERVDSEPGEGCPEASKVGTVQAETPILEDKVLHGELYIAAPYENPFDSLLALYMVIRDRELGVIVKLAGRVAPDPATGQLTTVFGEPGHELPQFPVSRVNVHLNEGARSPLISPPGCGAHTVTAKLTPWAGGAPTTSTSDFDIEVGPNGGPCPTGAAPFDPGFEAGTTNNAAGSYSPFLMRLSRGDGMQDLTKFAATLPPGVVGKVGGIPYCPEAGIARARSRTGEHGGEAELNDPSCPAASQIGRTVGGAGVGSQLTYVPGSLYLAGPYNGAPLSVVSITPAVAGPFDAGVVVVRVALDLDPVTAEVSADGSASDPIPHILQGIPLNVRDLRVYVDRPEFTLNATSCQEAQTRATLFGGGTVLAPTADTPVSRSARYQAAGCASLGFEPRLGIKLRGGTRRGGHPGLRAVVTPRPGDANFSRAVVKLPTSAFLDQAHIRTICTRVQFAAGSGNGAACPPGARYGYARAWSPLLDEPAQGPVYLRSSNNKLPDLVVALKGPDSAPFDVELSARIDSVRGGIRSTFPSIPDIPVSRFVLQMQGAKKGLIVNSRNLCFKPKRNRAAANIKGQNGRLSRTKPRLISLACVKRRKAKRSAQHRRARVARASQAR